jgi:hypothetical protein
MEGAQKYRIANVAAVVLAALALIADAFTLVPLVGDIVGPVFWVLASIYFWKKGMGIISGKQGITKIISTIAELIPGVQELPTIFVAMLIIIGTTRLEDKTGLPMNSVAAGKPGTKLNVAGTRLPPSRPPLNQGEFRPPNGGLAS